MLEIMNYISPLGDIVLASRDGALAGLWFEGQKYFMGAYAGEVQALETPVLLQTREWLNRYFAGEKPRTGELALAPAGSPFRQAVWKILCEIPYGETATYGEIASLMGRSRGSAQAVGGAVAHNPISIIIPCHRALGANGSFTGYAGGIEKKKWLLAHEGAQIIKG